MTLDCLLVEDEPLAMDRLLSYVGKFPWLNPVKCCSSGTEALHYLQSHPVDLVFLDINLGDLSGIQLLETLPKKPEVIILTAHHEFALKGYELSVTDYLLKPYTLERFTQAVEKVRDHQRQKSSPEKKEWLFVKSSHRLEKIVVEDILYIEGMRDYRKIHLSGGRSILTLVNFSELEKELTGTALVRVHKSYMVSLSKLDAVDKGGCWIGKLCIPISESYRDAFLRRVKGT